MRKTSKFICSFAIVGIIAISTGNGLALTTSFSDNTLPHTTLPVSVPASSFQVAGVYWLPDYLERNLDFNGGGTKPVITSTCASLGYISSVSYPYKSCTKFLAANKLYCYKNCICADEFQYDASNCKDGAVLGTLNASCNNKSDKCTCPTGYDVNVTEATCRAKGNGYVFEAKGKVGDKTCGKCIEVPCPISKSCGSYTCKVTKPASGRCGAYCSECNTCVSGGSNSCAGSTTGCASNQMMTSSCLDCQGNRRYTCRAKTCSELNSNYIDMNTYWCNGAIKCWLPQKL